MNKTELEQSMKARIDELESNIAVLKKEMAALQEVEKPAKWEPKGGPYSIAYDGTTRTWSSSNNHWRIAGVEFATKEAAESACAYRIFYQRLQCLAAELNPSGKVGGTWAIYWCTSTNCFHPSQAYASWTTGLLFETKQAAEKAAEILNTDGVKPPAISS